MANVKYDVYEEVTAQIIAALEKGVKPWECPWVSGAAGMPLRASGEAYRGINSVLLSMVAWQKGYTNPTWLTFNQAKNLGGMVRKGEKSALVVKYGTFEAVCETAVETDVKTDTRSYLKSYRVFNVEQIDGLEDQFPAPAQEDGFKTRPIEELSHISANMIENMGVDYFECGIRAYYNRTYDRIKMPEISMFPDAEQYYSTLFHELVHAAGHVSRCDRSKEQKGLRVGNAAYAREELCAEMGAAFLGAQLGFKPGHVEYNAQYIDGWLHALRRDKRVIVRAAAAAQKSAEYLMSMAQAKETGVAA